jgi:hypothetical protein
MDPSSSNIKCILCRHEDIIEGNSVDLRQFMGRLYQIVASLLQQIEILEHECQQLRSLVMPQQSQSAYTNQTSRIEENGEREVEPMEVEKNDSGLDKAQEAPDHEYAHQ